MLLEHHLVVVGELLREDGDPLLRLVLAGDVQVERLVVGHRQRRPGSLAGTGADVQEQEGHRFTKIGQHLETGVDFIEISFPAFLEGLAILKGYTTNVCSKIHATTAGRQINAYH